jgi:hypothetical protein
MPDPYITGPHAALIARQFGLAEQKRLAQLPAGIIDETMPREFATGGTALASGTLLLMGLVYIRARQPVTSLGTRTATVLWTSPTNQWMCLVRQSDLSVLAKTQDKTTEAWAASTDKNFTITGGPYVPAADTLAYIGIVGTHGGTPPTFWVSASGNALVMGISPVKAGTSTTGLTDPASLGATAGAITATVGHYRAWYS